MVIEVSNSTTSDVSVHLISWPPYSSFRVLVRHFENADPKLSRLEAALRDKGWSQSEVTHDEPWPCQLWDKTGGQTDGHWSDKDRCDLLASAVHAFTLAGVEPQFLTEVDGCLDWLDRKHGFAPAMDCPQEFHDQWHFAGDFPQQLYDQSADVIVRRPILLAGWVNIGDVSAFLDTQDENYSASVDWVVLPNTRGSATHRDYSVHVDLPDLDLRGGEVFDDDTKEALSRGESEFYGADARFCLLAGEKERVPPDQYHVTVIKDGEQDYELFGEDSIASAKETFKDVVETCKANNDAAEVMLTRTSRPPLTQFDGMHDPTVTKLIKSAVVGNAKAKPSA